MSSVIIMSLLVVGIVVLMMVVYANHLLEANKLDKARQRADLTDRINRCASLATALPGQFVSAELKLLLARVELSLSQRLQSLEKNNAALAERAMELTAMVKAGANKITPNPPRPMDKEAKVKDLRFQLEALHGQLGRAAHDGIIPANDAKAWVEEIKKMLVLAHTELFETVGRQALQQQQPRQARLAFERGVQYLRKQPNQAPYKLQLTRLEELLDHSEKLVLAIDAPETVVSSELTDGISTIEDDSWKKKNIYD
ncbi:hypothetical protein [Pseudomonas matsuisoli]|uniref:Uncharacterized protein n=1 Tax=Pseudomonas matsuisoli TaxID=1515666 RepID=A0A917URB5_9PSED|nr:hypothetical protein [Pseudomonas matsuisoli]GGJ79028.1 hypothetical protein GCM10009304_01130 [Pseudomonas matsuisoli]